jgi:NAD(P)-dependent dehydrogenase (short-subunit alcohol dehydrogenase family)
MQTRMDGKVALVTGGSSGLGRAIAKAFVAAGAKVVVTGRREAELAAAARETGAVAVPGDARDPGAAQRAVAACVERFGGLTTLVNNAGVIGNGTVEKSSRDEWSRIVSISVDGTFETTRAAIPELRKAGGARGASVLNFSSVAGSRPFAGLTAYCMAKAAVEMMTRCLALELAPDGVRVNAMAPGVIVTNLHTVTGAIPDYPAFLERSKATHPLGFVGAAEDAASLALFLCGDTARWITGAIVPLDGGRALMSAR